LWLDAVSAWTDTSLWACGLSSGVTSAVWACESAGGWSGLKRRGGVFHGIAMAGHESEEDALFHRLYVGRLGRRVEGVV